MNNPPPAPGGAGGAGQVAIPAGMQVRPAPRRRPFAFIHRRPRGHGNGNENGNDPNNPQDGGNEPNPQAECWSRCFFTLIYLLFELVIFIAILSVAIGISVLASLTKQYFWNLKMSTFLQTYITLWVLHNLSYLQARHQLVHVYPLRARFGPNGLFFFKCDYPGSMAFFTLCGAYFSLFYQFSQLFCIWPGDHWKSHQKHIDEKSSTQGFIPEIGTTTALFLLSLSGIQYLSARKLRWDFYCEVSRLERPPVFPTCCSYIYAILSLSFLQLILTVFYLMPLLLWLWLSRFFQWEISTTIISAVAITAGLGHLGSFFERSQSFQTLHGGAHHIANLHVRNYLLCGIFIPFIAYWFFKMEEVLCQTPPVKSGISGSTGSSGNEVDLTHFFLINTAVCILCSIKYASLTHHSVHHHHNHHHPHNHNNHPRNNNENPDPNPNANDNGNDNQARPLLNENQNQNQNPGMVNLNQNAGVNPPVQLNLPDANPNQSELRNPNDATDNEITLENTKDKDGNLPRITLRSVSGESLIRKMEEGIEVHLDDGPSTSTSKSKSKSRSKSSSLESAGKMQACTKFITVEVLAEELKRVMNAVKNKDVNVNVDANGSDFDEKSRIENSGNGKSDTENQNQNNNPGEKQPQPPKTAER